MYKNSAELSCKDLYPNNTRDVYLYIYSVSAYMG